MGEEGGFASAAAVEAFDDDGRPRRTGTLWTASAHIITAVIGSGVLSLAWAMAQLGWVAGTASLFLFSVVTFFTSSLLSDCYRTPDPVHGKRNYTYMAAVKASLGKTQILLCGACQYVNLVGTAIGYTITTAASCQAISVSNCYHFKGHDADCTDSESKYMIAFGIMQVFLSQLPDLQQLWWLSIVAAVMSFAYATIAIGLSATKLAMGSSGSTSLTGVEIGVDVTSAEKVWNSFQALGNIAFAYSYSMILIEIQDTLRSSPAENKVMKRASLVGVLTTTGFYLLCGCVGYAAFGNNAPGNILTGFGYFEPFWLVDFANICIIVHLIGAYQVFTQPIFAAVEKLVAPSCANIKVFRLVWRTAFVAITTFFAMLIPFFNDILGLLGAVGFWPLTVYFPIEMYIRQRKIGSTTPKWFMLKTLSFLCFIVTMIAAVGSIQGIIHSLAKRI